MTDPGPGPAPPFWARPAADVAADLRSGEAGLTAADAAARLAAHPRHGPRVTPWWRSLLAQFASPIVLVLIGAAVVSAFVGDLSDAAIILGIVLVSGLLGFWQERGAADAVARLLALVRVTARVRRDGSVVEVPLDEVVPGDVVELDAGATVPGDALLLDARDLSIDQSALTGESFPADKTPGTVDAAAGVSDRTNVCFLGTHVVSGTGTLLVVLTGDDTEFGKVSARLQAAAPPTEFERGLRRLGVLLLRVTLTLAVAIFGFNVVLRKPVLDSLLFSVALAVGLTPQLLPAIVAVNLSHGAKRMAKARVITKRLAAIENLGSMTVLCSDKTGTLTEGKVEVGSARDVEGADAPRALALARLNAHLETGFANPIDEALRAEPPPDGYRKLDEVPYDFQRRRLTVLVDGPDGRTMVTKGALSSVFEVCATVETGSGPRPAAEMVGAIEALREQLEGQGSRLLGVAERRVEADRVDRSDERDMSLVGILSLADPPKPDAATSIADLHRLGVQAKMITGDSHRVAGHIATQVGLDGSGVLTGGEIAALGDDDLAARVGTVHVFAEVDPTQKERIVAALRSAGEVVGYLGDGINDAPSLHAADVGISVDSAADVAKQAADFVLLERDLDVLVDGIEEGRATFANTMKYVFAATSANFGNMFSMAGASLFLSYLPLLPKQVLLTNLLTDLPEMTIASDRVDRVVIDTPERWDVGTIRRFMLSFGLLSSVFDYATFGVLLLVLGAGRDEFRTGWFVESVVSAVLIVLVVRTRLPVTRSRPGRGLAVAAVTVVALVVALPFLPFASTLGFVSLPARFYAALAVVVACYVGSAEILKRRFFASQG